MPPPGRARTEEAKEDRRRDMVAAALDAFFDKGFAAARMDDIAAAAGVSKGTLYLYFPSKEALFAALVEDYAIPNVVRMETIADTSPSAVQAIRAALQLAPYLVRESNIPRIAKILIGESAAFPALVADYRERVLDRVLGALTRLLERGHAAGEIHAPHAHLTVRLIFAPVFLSAIWRVVFDREGPESVDPEALLALHEQNIMAALTCPPPAGDAPAGRKQDVE